MTTKINPSEISSIIKKKIDEYKGAATEANVGEVLSTADGIVQIYGLEDAMYGELLDFGEGTFGLALNLENSAQRWSKIEVQKRFKIFTNLDLNAPM